MPILLNAVPRSLQTNKMIKIQCKRLYKTLPPCTPGSTDHNILSNAIYTMKTVTCHPKKGDAFALTFATAENWLSGKSLTLGASAGTCAWVYSTGGKLRKHFSYGAEGQEVYTGLFTPRRVHSHLILFSQCSRIQGKLSDAMGAQSSAAPPSLHLRLSYVNILHFRRNYCGH